MRTPDRSYCVSGPRPGREGSWGAGAQVITAEKSRRTVEYAFGFAFLNNRRKVTAIHKANIMKLSDGLFLKARPARAGRNPTPYTL